MENPDWKITNKKHIDFCHRILHSLRTEGAGMCKAGGASIHASLRAQFFLPLACGVGVEVGVETVKN